MIESGELLPGGRLPSERELAARYGAARNTAREAIRLLSDEPRLSPSRLSASRVAVDDTWL